MANPMRLFACACFAALVSGCATFGTNVEGDFTCRAPKGDCAPSHVIDARATAVIEDGAAGHDLTRVRAGIAGGDTTRTAERTLRIVFPAHVDEAGTLHDEAVAWTVVENPRWAAELRRKVGEETALPLMWQLRRQLKAAQAEAEAEAVAEPARDETDDADLTMPFSASPSDTQNIPAASPLALPSTAREAVAGARAPAVEGFNMSPPLHDRTPRPTGNDAALTFPSIEAIEAAKAASAAPAAPTPEKERK